MASFTHLGLEMDPMLVCLFVMERHPRVRHIIHQVVPVPRRHRGRQTDRRHWSFGSTRRCRPDSKRSSPVRDSRASPAVSSRWRRSPLLLPWASKGPILKRARLRASLLIPEWQSRLYFLICGWKRCAQQRKDRVSRAGRGKSTAGVPALFSPASCWWWQRCNRLPLPICPLLKAESKAPIGAKLPYMTQPGAERGKNTPAIPPAAATLP